MSYHPRASLEAFSTFQFPEDMLTEAGYVVPVSQITDEHKRKILGENYAAIHGIDIEARKAAIATHEFAQRRAEYRDKRPYSSTSIAGHMESAPAAGGVPV